MNTGQAAHFLHVKHTLAHTYQYHSGPLWGLSTEVQSRLDLCPQ